MTRSSNNLHQERWYVNIILSDVWNNLHQVRWDVNVIISDVMLNTTTYLKSHYIHKVGFTNDHEFSYNSDFIIALC